MIELTQTVIAILSELFVLALAVGVLAIVVMYVIDVTQTKHAVRRNFPVIGRFRYFFETLGEFFRQFLFAQDREELPFNRAFRSWVYRAAKGEDTTVAFGSTRDLRPPGTLLFANCAFPTLEEDSAVNGPLVIGAECPNPYAAPSFFNISGMSFGALSRPAVEALSRGAKAAHIWVNTGEGGLSPYHLEGGADIVFQIGTAKYGVRDRNGLLDESKLAAVAAHPQVKLIELKLAQGAKPGKGGMLPGIKVTEEIARIRLIEPGKDSNSPNRHPDIATCADLLDQVARIRRITGKPVGIKNVLGSDRWLIDLCDEIDRRGHAAAPDFLTIDSADGGSGAAPMSLIDYMGLPIRESLPLTVDTLAARGLRERIRIVASGKLITPAEVAWALCVGADFINTARGFMFALGCIQSLKCNKNTCPTGVTTHDPRLQRGLDPIDKAERVRRYAETMINEVGVIAHSCGVSEPRQLRREHCRVVQTDGRSVPLDALYPYRRAL